MEEFTSVYVSDCFIGVSNQPKTRWNRAEMAEVRNADTVSRMQGKAFLFQTCYIFDSLNTFLNSHITDRHDQITTLAWGTCDAIAKIIQFHLLYSSKPRLPR